MSNRPLALLSAAIVLCPLVPLHFAPQPDFYTEWVFAMLVCMAWLSVQQSIVMPRLRQSPIMLAVLLVGIAAIISFVFGRGHGPAPTLTILYCFFGLFLYALTRSLLVASESAGDTSQKLAMAMLWSGILACLPAAFQLNWLAPGVLLVVERGVSSAIYGNLAQYNLLADWLWLSICATAYLAGCARISKLVAFLTMGLLSVFALFTSSRSVWLYGFVVLIVMFLTRSKEKGGSQEFSQGIWVGAAILMQGIWHGVLTWTGGYDQFGIHSSAERMQDMVGAEATPGLRWSIWLRGLKTIQESPWVGEGPGSFSWSAWQVMATPGDHGPAPVGENAHNLFLELAVEFGIPLALIIAILLFWWVRRWFGRPIGATAQWALASVSVIGVHGFLEYPFWTTEFLGLALMFCAVVDHHLEVGPSGRQVSIAGFRFIGVLGLAILALLYVQFRPAELAHKEFELQAALGLGLPFMNDEMAERLQSVPDWSPMRSYSEAAAAATATPNVEEASRWGPLCDRVVQYKPSPLALARCVVIFELMGMAEKSDRMAELGCIAYPREQNHFPDLVHNLTRLMKSERMPVASCLSKFDGD